MEIKVTESAEDYYTVALTIPVKITHELSDTDLDLFKPGVAEAKNIEYSLLCVQLPNKYIMKVAKSSFGRLHDFIELGNIRYHSLNATGSNISAPETRKDRWLVRYNVARGLFRFDHKFYKYLGDAFPDFIGNTYSIDEHHYSFRWSFNTGITLKIECSLDNVPENVLAEYIIRLVDKYKTDEWATLH